MVYIASHGTIRDGNNVLFDNGYFTLSNWYIWSNKSYGNWHFVFLDACYTSATNNFANSFGINGSGKCFVGWNISIENGTVIDFDRRFLPRLGSMSVHDAVVTSLWESRNAGYNTGNAMCNPGFIGDTNYYGWAW